MNATQKGLVWLLWFSYVAFFITGLPLFFFSASVVILVLATHPPARPQLRRSRGVRIDSGGLTTSCYDYGGCQWWGDGCKGRPVVMGSGNGCPHFTIDGVRQDKPGKRSLDLRTCEVCTRVGTLCKCPGGPRVPQRKSISRVAAVCEVCGMIRRVPDGVAYSGKCVKCGGSTYGDLL